MDDFQEKFNDLFKAGDFASIEQLIKIMRRKVPAPSGGTVVNDPLRGLDRPPQSPSQVLPFSEPWKLRAGNRMNLSLPAPRGAQFGVYADIDNNPFKVLGGGIQYRQDY